MNGKSNVFHYLNMHGNEKILVIADGAAFGSEIDRVLRLIRERKNVALYLPESFEWMILSSGVLKNNQVDKILGSPSEFVESGDYFSWERFFTAVLIEETKDTYLAYAKKKLNPVYLNGAVKQSILEQRADGEGRIGLEEEKLAWIYRKETGSCLGRKFGEGSEL